MKFQRGAFSLFFPRSSRFENYLKRRYVRPGQTRLHRKRIFILPTNYGLMFAVTLFVMLLGSLNYNNSLGFVLTFLLGGVALMSTFHTFRNISQLAIRPSKATPTFAGQDAIFNVIVDNDVGPARYAVSLVAENQNPTTVDVAASATTSAQLALPTKKRGRISLGIIKVETRFPLGLYRAWSYAPMTSTCLVYPKPAHYFTDPLPQHDEGGDRSTINSGTEDFMGFRHYHPGDSTRHINWKAVARGQPLFSKQFDRNETQELWLDWNQAPGDTESRLSQLCRWVLDADTAQCIYGLRLPDTTIAPATGATHKHRCLEALALF